MANMVRRQEPTTVMSPFGGRDPFRLMRELVRWNPFHELDAFPAWGTDGFVPNFDVKETKDALVLQADLPGLTEKDVNISVTGNRLTVSGERKAEEKKEDENYYTFERSYGAFTRTFTLPDEVDADEVRAELKDGVLTVTLPKRPEAKARRVPLRAGN